MKTIEQMAEEAGIDVNSDTLCRYEGWLEPMQRFAALVAEECASIAENVATPHGREDGEVFAAAAIRKRFTATAGNSPTQAPKLPARFMESGLSHAKGARIFGQLLESLSREELLAVAANGWLAERRAREEGRKAVDALWTSRLA